MQDRRGQPMHVLIETGGPNWRTRHRIVGYVDGREVDEPAPVRDLASFNALTPLEVRDLIRVDPFINRIYRIGFERGVDA